MVKGRWAATSLISLMLLFATLSFCWAQDDLQDIPDPPYYPPNAVQPYTQYPSQSTQQQAPPQHVPWYKKLFSPMTRRMNPPIYRAKKVPTGKPRETKPLGDPLIRLAKGISYHDTDVPPGFYIIHLSPGKNSGEASLVMMREDQPVLMVPAKQLSADSTTSSDTTVTASETLPAPPDKKAAGSEGDLKDAASAFVTLAQDGQSVMIVYQKGDTQYQSVPLAVGDDWRP